jgi:hypothetical protein
MAITKKTGISGLSSRKEVRKILTVQLENALTELKKELGDDKFQLRLKKAIKALTKDFNGVHASEEVTIVDVEPIAEKLPSKGKKVAAKKAAIKKSAKKKAVKAQHPDTPSK